MMIEESIAQKILHQQKDVIAQHLGQIHEKMCEMYTREEVLLDNEHSPDNNQPGMYVRLEYSNKSRSWSLDYGDKIKKMSRYWASEGFLHYDDDDKSNWMWLAEQLVEGVIQHSLEEEY